MDEQLLSEHSSSCRPLAPVRRRRTRRRVHRRTGPAYPAARAEHRRPEPVPRRPGPFDPAAIRIGQAIADVATISLLHERSMRHSDTLNEQLQTALHSRVIIEQAKGKLAERLGTDMNQAFNLLRDFARTATSPCPTWPAPSSTAPKHSPA